MKVTYLDLKTGKIATETGISAFQLAENNWSCDCNRQMAFGIESDRKCRSMRFIVIDIEREPQLGFDGREKEEIIAEANSDYFLRLKHYEELRSEQAAEDIDLKHPVIGPENEKAPGQLKLEDYVFASRWPDCDWNDPWAVGFVAAIGENYVRLSNEDGSPIEGVGHRSFSYAMKVTKEQAASIIIRYSTAEGRPFDKEEANDIFKKGCENEEYFGS